MPIYLEHFVQNGFTLFKYHQVFIMLGVEAGRFALAVRSDLDALAGEPCDLPASRDAQPKLPVQHVTILAAEPTYLHVCFGSDRDRRAAEWIITKDHLLGHFSRIEDPIDRPQTTESRRILDLSTSIVDRRLVAGDQSDALVLVECRDMRSEVPGTSTSSWWTIAIYGVEQSRTHWFQLPAKPSRSRLTTIAHDHRPWRERYRGSYLPSCHRK